MFLIKSEMDKHIQSILNSGLKPVSKEAPRYPLTNICTDSKDILYIQIACAGFKKEDLSIEKIKDVGLVISGKYSEELGDYKYYQKHISERSFERKISLVDEYFEGEFAIDYADGLLTIVIKPKEIKPKEPEKIKLKIN